MRCHILPCYIVAKGPQDEPPMQCPHKHCQGRWLCLPWLNLNKDIIIFPPCPTVKIASSNLTYYSRRTSDFAREGALTSSSESPWDQGKSVGSERLCFCSFFAFGMAASYSLDFRSQISAFWLFCLLNLNSSFSVLLWSHVMCVMLMFLLSYSLCFPFRVWMHELIFCSHMPLNSFL